MGVKVMRVLAVVPESTWGGGRSEQAREGYGQRDGKRGKERDTQRRSQEQGSSFAAHMCARSPEVLHWASHRVLHQPRVPERWRSLTGAKRYAESGEAREMGGKFMRILARSSGTHVSGDLASWASGRGRGRSGQREETTHRGRSGLGGGRGESGEGQRRLLRGFLYVFGRGLTRHALGVTWGLVERESTRSPAASAPDTGRRSAAWRASGSGPWDDGRQSNHRSY